MDVSHLRKVVPLMDEVARLLSTGPASYYFDTLLSAYNELLTRAPFPIGSRVALTRTPNIEKASGWAAYRHFLITGSKGTVKSVEWWNASGNRPAGFRFDIQFDDDLSLEPGTFTFGESSLRMVRSDE